MNEKTRAFMAGLLLIVFTLSIVIFVRGDPVGGSIQSNTTSQRSDSAGSRADDGGTISTLVVDATQQNAAWKAYVGNISGTLVLDDSSDVSIYEWTLTTLTGEILATRASSLTWSYLSCASNATIASEQTYLSMTSADVDSLNKTFNTVAHKSFTVAGNTLSANTCRTVATYVNDTSQTINSSALFQEILVNDSSSNIIYMSGLETDAYNYRTTENSTFDFQMIVPDNDAANNITTYYFYVELDS